MLIHFDKLEDFMTMLAAQPPNIESVVRWRGDYRTNDSVPGHQYAYDNVMIHACYMRLIGEREAVIELDTLVGILSWYHPPDALGSAQQAREEIYTAIEKIKRQITVEARKHECEVVAGCYKHD